jgi:FAS-associated factor 2
LQITTYPSLTFFSLLPPATGSTTSASVSNARLTILTTIAGSPATTTSLPSILHLLDSTLIPRSQPFLARVKRERRALEESRRMREDQDRRAAESARRDSERIMASRREREERERLEREETERKQKAERERQSKEALVKRLKNDLLLWRRYQRRRFREMVEVPAEDVKAGLAVRIQLRLPQGNGPARNIKVFRKDDESLADIFRWAESLLLATDKSPDEDPTTSPAGFVDPYASVDADDGQSVSHTPVKLFTSYPRKEVGLRSGSWDVIVQGGGSLIVEVDRSASQDADDSEYETDDED